MQSAPARDTERQLELLVPSPVRAILETFSEAGHAAFVVGGSLRDALLGRSPADWDLATDARPDRIGELFPGSVYENRFGTVGVRRGGVAYEITTFRREHDYADHRRPHRVEFGTSIDEDLARRDFTVNAMAWGTGPGGTSGKALGAEPGLTPGGVPRIRPEAARPVFVDPFGGRADLDARLLRAVGRPIDRFEEDALRMVRAVRLAATLDFTIEPATLDAITSRAELARHLSGERIAAELGKLLAALRPSVGLRLLVDTGLLEVISPELAAQRGVTQSKIPGDDLWDHTVRTVDAVPVDRPTVRLAALLHDIGKPATAADGHFYQHETIGAELAEDLLRQLRFPRATIERVAHLVRQHMFRYEGSWSDAAIRRFIGKTKVEALEELFALREADSIGSGLPADSGGLRELRLRVANQLAAEVALDRSGLAVDGDDLMDELSLSPGPIIGRILDGLLDRVIADPRLNDRASLLMLAQSMLTEDR